MERSAPVRGSLSWSSNSSQVLMAGHFGGGRGGGFQKIGVPHLGVLTIRILLFKVAYYGPLFSETPV